MRILITLCAVAAVSLAARGALIPPAGSCALRAFVLPTPGEFIGTGSGNPQATELWVEDVRTHERRRLVRGAAHSDMRRVIAAISDPMFSPDGGRLYFNSEAWAVSGAVHCVDLKTGKVSYLIDGDIRGVLSDGALLVGRNLVKYDASGESLGRDCYLWLVSPCGEPLQEIGLDESPGSAAVLQRTSRR